MTTVHATYSSFLTAALSGSLKRGGTNEELKAIFAKVCDFERSPWIYFLPCARQKYIQ